jgi:hypothetical protein
MKLIQALSEAERELVRRCLHAAVNGPFFPDWEFHALFGYTRDEVRRILAGWPDAKNEDQQRNVIINTLNNLLRYPHGETEAWNRDICSSEDDVAAILRKLTTLVQEDSKP